MRASVDDTALHIISDAKADLAAMPVNMEGKGTHPKGVPKAKLQRKLSGSLEVWKRDLDSQTFGNLWGLIPKAASAQVHHGSSWFIQVNWI